MCHILHFTCGNTGLNAISAMKNGKRKKKRTKSEKYTSHFILATQLKVAHFIIRISHIFYDTMNELISFHFHPRQYKFIIHFRFENINNSKFLLHSEMFRAL